MIDLDFCVHESSTDFVLSFDAFSACVRHPDCVASSSCMSSSSKMVRRTRRSRQILHRYWLLSLDSSRYFNHHRHQLLLPEGQWYLTDAININTNALAWFEFVLLSQGHTQFCALILNFDKKSIFI